MTMRTFDLGIVEVNGEGDWLAASLALAFGFFAHSFVPELVRLLRCASNSACFSGLASRCAFAKGFN